MDFTWIFLLYDYIKPELIVDVLAAGSIIMGTDKNNHYLVTGDVDGTLKVWDIIEYAIAATDTLITAPPRESDTL